jgi:Ser/Thr protein kinase RdoA (MazF antagonist)
MYNLLKEALLSYSLGKESLTIENELKSWSNDLHFKIWTDGKAYSARFLKEDRSPNNVFGEMNAEILYEQTEFCRYLVDQQIPFMKLVPETEGQPFTEIKWQNENFYFILFEWIDGQHITHGDENIAREFGKTARKFHDVSSVFTSSLFKKKSHLVGYEAFIGKLRNKILTSNISSENKKIVDEYLSVAKGQIELARTEKMDFIIQSDLNPLNVLWDEKRNVTGIVDFESIGYDDRIEGLAWLIKWYSRTEGIHSSEMSPALAEAFLQGYGAPDFLEEKDYSRLASLVWLSGCMNWNFVEDTASILETNDRELLKSHIDFYKQRGEKLRLLIPKALF